MSSAMPLEAEDADSIAAQEAICHWRSLGFTNTVSRFEVLKPGHRRSSVFRLFGAGLDGSPIIAKRSAAGAVRLEHRVYSELLDGGPASSVQCHGIVTSGNSALAWLFLEDAGDAHFDHSVPEHRALAAEWLARVHVWSNVERPSVVLPDRGVAFQHGVVRAARSTIEHGLTNPWVSAEQRDLLMDLVAHFGLLEQRWDQISAALRAFPATLVHGDFAGKNVRVRPTERGLELLPLDFGAGGRGVPAADLSQVDLATYRATVEPRWRRLDLDLLQSVSVIGRVLWCAAAIPGERSAFATPWTHRLVGKLTYYEASISSALVELDLG